MSVLGIDFGNESCYIAVARQGGIETIANDYSLRATHSCVAFGEKTRILGVAAKNQLVTNMKNTCINFKRLIGKQYRDPRILEELKCLPYKVIEQKDGSIGIVVTYLSEEQVFSTTQITAMLFSKLKHTAETALGIKVTDVVLGVPCYFDDAERHAVLEAATIAGLNVLRLINETTAVALAYGIYKQDLPSPEEKPRNVIFVDCGQSNLQISAVAFNKGKLKMLTTTANAYLGGRDMDKVLADHFSAEFKTRYKLNVKSNARAWTRLLTEVEKMKKQMSANSTDLPMNIECFMNDIDVSGKLKRATMEELCSSILKRVEDTLSRCLADSGLKVDDIYSVELIGGSSRTPAIKLLIEKLFKKVPSTTLNADEAVARGCALQCAMLSPAFKVREFSITDVQPYSIKLIWQDDSGLEADMEVFPRNHQIPFSKMLTFYRKGPFTLQAQYSNPSPCPDPVIGHFTVNDVMPTPEGENQKVKVKVRVNIHGLFTVASATLTEKKEMVEEDSPPPAMDTDEKEKDILHTHAKGEWMKLDPESPESYSGRVGDGYNRRQWDSHYEDYKYYHRDACSMGNYYRHRNRYSSGYAGYAGYHSYDSSRYNNNPRQNWTMQNGPDNGQQQEVADGESGKENDPSHEQKMETDKPSEQTTENQKPPEQTGEKKLKKVTKTIDLGVVSVVKGLPTNILNSLVEQESQMIQNDKLENERINAKNAVEEYVYDMRGKIYDELEKYISETDRTCYSRRLDDTENWLYEDGEDCSKQVYVDKLAELKKHGEPIKIRRREREELPYAFESLLSSIQKVNKIVESFKDGDENYSHLDTAEMEKVEKMVGEKQHWVDKSMGSLTVTSLDRDVPVTAQQVRSEKGTFEAVVNPIISKPKPKPKVEDPPPVENPDKENKTEDATSNGPTKEEPKPEGGKASEEPMDVD